LPAKSTLIKDLNIIYCNDRVVADLNKRFKSKDGVTDVLAFNLEDHNDDAVTGEIYIDLQQARRQAEENKVSFMEEVTRLTIHGVLHLLGYRDDSPGRRKKMWALQEKYLYK
jgi:probable rRNA maturation factor